jgi:dethiobiotin synthetase
MSELSLKNSHNSIEWHTASCFVTGTDTGVGKTMMTGALALAMQSKNHTVGIMKPVETGQAARKTPQLMWPRSWRFIHTFINTTTL